MKTTSAMQVAKDSDSGTRPRMVNVALARSWAAPKGSVMKAKTCAACDCELDQNAIRVTIGGNPVDVCCEECAQKLKEAHASARTVKE